MNTTKETIRLYWRTAWAYKRYVVGLMVVMPLTILVHQFLPPLISADILSRLSSGNFEPGNIWGSFGPSLVLFAVCVFAGSVVAWRICIYLIWKLEGLVTRDLSKKVFKHLISLSLDFHANHFGGSLVSQTGNLVSAYIRMADTVIFQIAPLILSFIYTAILLWPRSPLFVVVLLVISVIYMWVAVVTTRRVRDLGADESAAQNKKTGILADSITNIAAVKSFSTGSPEAKHFAKAAENMRQATIRLMWGTLKRETYFGSISSVMDILSLLLAVASVVVFKADIATVFLVLTYTGNVLSKLWDFSNSSLRNYNRAIGDAKAMVEILNSAPDVKDPSHPEKTNITNGAIQFNDVIFAHADANQDDTLFDNLNLQIEAGQRIGLVGPSGSGKTTLTKILLRFADINGGSITIDGQNIAHITQDNLRSKIAYVPQEPLLFHRTIRENIAYGRPNATDDEVRAAAVRANAAEFIEKLPKGYNTEVGERGVKLSGGQRQRIAIARAMLKDAPILVLDEATSALDSESERLIQSALWELMKGRTAIVIAHRLSTIQRMDRIVVLQDGQITEQGTHAELLAKQGVYAGLWAHQSGGFLED